jgi:hypothetical protein
MTISITEVEARQRDGQRNGQADHHPAQRQGGGRIALADQLHFLVGGEQGVEHRAGDQHDQGHRRMQQGDREAGGEGLDFGRLELRRHGRGLPPKTLRPTD